MNKTCALFMGLVASSTVVVANVSSAQAATLTAQDIVNAGCVNSLSACNVNGFSVTPGGVAAGVTATTPVLTSKVVGGVLGVGVAQFGSNPSNKWNPDPSQGEIDKGESLTIGFANAIVSSFDLSFLYRPGVYADQVYEIAAATTNSLVTGILTVTGPSTATWSLGGSVINLSPSNTNKGGSYRVLNPFGSTAISSVSFAPVLNGSAATSFHNSDFTFSRIETGKVPEPSAIAGLSLLGMMAVGSRLRRIARSTAE